MGIEPSQLEEIFNIRNKIIHELDIDLKGDRSKRNLRRQDDMVNNTDTLLRIGLKLVETVDKKLVRMPAASQKRASKSR